MDAQGLGPDGKKTAAPDDPEFRAQVFRTEAGEEGDPQTTKANVVYVVSVNGAIPPKVKPLAEVRAAAQAAWTDQQRIILLKKKAQELAAQANRDKAIEGIAKAIGASVQKSPALNHNTADGIFSAQLVDALFKAKPGETVYGPKGQTGDYVVARVTGILHPPLPEKSPQYLMAVREISASAGSGMTETYIAQIKADQGVTTNQKLLNSVIGSEGS
jgi:peptidyl-prolyl cis-trans isomerase D